MIYRFIQENKFSHIESNMQCHGQHVQNYEEFNEDLEEVDHLLGYLNTVLKFIHDYLDVNQEDLNHEYQITIKNRLFDVFEEQLCRNCDFNKKRKTLPSLFNAVEHAIGNYTKFLLLLQ